MHKHINQQSSLEAATPNRSATTGRVIRWARFYDPLVQAMALGRAAAIRAATLEIAATAGSPLGSATVLEVGCGTAELALAAVRGPLGDGMIYGIDPSAEMIAVARAKAQRLERAAGQRIDLRVGVIEALPFADGMFDLVLSSLMLHHLPLDLKRRGLAEVRRVLKPGGRLVAVDFRRPATALERAALRLMLHGGQREGIEALPELLAAAGFSAIAMPASPFRTLGFVVATAGG